MQSELMREMIILHTGIDNHSTLDTGNDHKRKFLPMSTSVCSSSSSFLVKYKVHKKPCVGRDLRGVLSMGVRVDIVHGLRGQLAYYVLNSYEFIVNGVFIKGEL